MHGHDAAQGSDSSSLRWSCSSHVTTLLAPLALKPLMKDLPEDCSV
jgi:hypothetical protein